MIVDPVSVRRTAEHAEIAAAVRPETAPGEAQEVWFRFPPRYGEALTPDGSPFLAASLLPAMMRGERLRVAGPVAPELLESAARIQAIYAQWVRGARIIPVEAPSAPDAAAGLAATTPDIAQPITPEVTPGVAPAAGGVGCFFSGGVDSFYTYLRHREEITHLILILGFDIALRDEGVRRETTARLERLCAAEEKELVIVETNVRELSDPLVGWGMAHGAVLGAIGLSMSGVLSRLYIPSSYAYRELFPWGSHPLLDPLWSTRTLTFVHDGCEALRVDKVLALSAFEPALRSLRVCWKHKAERRNEYNCGACEKCLRTMLALHLAGALPRCQTFPRPLTARSVRRMVIKRPGTLHHAMESLELLRQRSDPLSRRLFRALRRAVRRARVRMALEALRGKLP